MNAALFWACVHTRTSQTACFFCSSAAVRKKEISSSSLSFNAPCVCCKRLLEFGGEVLTGINKTGGGKVIFLLLISAAEDRFGKKGYQRVTTKLLSFFLHGTDVFFALPLRPFNLEKSARKSPSSANKTRLVTGHLSQKRGERGREISECESQRLFLSLRHTNEIS